MKNLRCTLLLAAVVCSLHAASQAIETSFDKKIIHTDSLNMPRNTSASGLLTLLPELLQRPGNFLLSNYDIQVEGMSVGDAADVALYQMQMVDIEKIEVVESPLSSYQNNGQGGSINIILRSAGKDNDRLWGSANGGYGKLTLGANFHATMGSEAAIIDDAMTVGGEIERGVPQNDSHYLMPYLTFTFCYL